MVAVYSSALIFDLWYKITNCKDSSALSHLFNGETEGGEGEPKTWRGVGLWYQSLPSIPKAEQARCRNQPLSWCIYHDLACSYAHVSSIKKNKLWEAIFCLIQNPKVKEISAGWWKNFLNLRLVKACSVERSRTHSYWDLSVHLPWAPCMMIVLLRTPA